MSIFVAPVENEVDLIAISQKTPQERISEIERILDQYSDFVLKNSALLLLGKSYLENKEYEKAEKILSNKSLLDSDLGEYAIYYLISAKTALKKNQFPEELWMKLVFAEGEPSFKNEALKQLSDFYINSKNYLKAIEFLNNLSEDEKEKIENISKLALCYLETKNEDKSLPYAKKMYISFPLNRLTVEFFKKYPLLIGKMAALTAEEKIKRLFVLEETKGFYSLEKESTETAKFLDKNQKSFLEASLLFYKGKEFEALKKCLSINPQSFVYPKALLRASQNIKTLTSKTLELEKKIVLLDNIPQKEKALVNLFNFYKKRKFDNDTERVAKELLKFSNSDASEYLFQRAFENYLEGKIRKSVEILQNLVDLLPKENDYHQAALFSLIKMGKINKEEKELAKSELLTFSKYGYYGYRLRNGEPPKIEAESQFIPPYIQDPLPKSRIYKSNLLIESGLVEEAVSELEYVISKDEKPEYLWQLALTASKGMIYPKSVRAVRRLYPNAYTSEGDKIPKQAWEMLYPLPYYQEFQKIAEEKNISLILLFSMARQESLFDRKAVSRANAMGIIQLIPTTASLAAKKANVSFNSKEQLFDVEYNLRLGSTYFLSVYQNLDKNLVFALGAYNAGPGNMQNWRNRENNPRDEDIFIESIPFKETRSYIKRILNNIYEYERIYPELKINEK